MRSRLLLAIILLLLAPAAGAEGPGFQNELLDRFVGQWVMRGTIAGGEIVHDLEAAWVLGHHYLQFHELAREQDADGRPAYEAIVTIGWEEAAQRYACLWLDSTGGSGLDEDAVMGHAVREGDTLPFKFRMDEDSLFHTTFIYHRESDTWEWTMDSERDGEMRPFARVTLTRR